MGRDIINIILALMAIASAIVSVIGYYICGCNVIQAIFDMGGSYTTAINWFITSLSCTFGARILRQFIKRD